jgi:hypothetical protein
VLECVENGIKSPDLDVDRAIRLLRERRPLMVQSVAQYRFCYTSVLSGIRRMLNIVQAEGAKITAVRATIHTVASSNIRSGCATTTHFC